MPGLMQVEYLATRHGGVPSHDIRMHLWAAGVEINEYDQVDEDKAEKALKEFEPHQPKPGVTDEY